MAALAAPAARRPLAETIRTARREEAANILTVGTIPGTIPGTMSNDQQLARWLKSLAQMVGQRLSCGKSVHIARPYLCIGTEPRITFSSADLTRQGMRHGAGMRQAVKHQSTMPALRNAAMRNADDERTASFEAS